MKVVVIGGGTGTFKILSGLKRYGNLDLSAIVAITDDGGSGGKLRDEFGYLPTGDIRQCIAALAESNESSSLMRDLFMYRFEKGGVGLAGHTFGNLFLTAMIDLMHGDQEKAINYVSKILHIKGNVIPVSLADSEIAVEQSNGTITIGESKIKDSYMGRDVKSPIINCWLQPRAHATRAALEAISSADLLILGPGGLYTSLITNLLVEGIRESILKSSGKVLFNINLMSDAGQTYGMNCNSYVEILSTYLGKYPDFVLLNNRQLSPALLHRYKKSMDFPVEDDLLPNQPFTVIRADLLPNKSGKIKQRVAFGTKMSVLRHDSDKVAKIIIKRILSKI